MQQQTLKKAIQFKGVGLHTGKEITLELQPAAEHTGYRICRSDLEGCPEFPATADLVESTKRATQLKKGGFSVSTIEHAVAALYAMGIDNCRMLVDGPEFPILDGSAKPYVDAIAAVGLETQKFDREYYVVTKPIDISDPETGARLLMIPNDTFAIESHVSFTSDHLQDQQASWQEGEDFKEEIAAARSFVFLRDILPLLSDGLIKGGSLANALIIKDTAMSSEEEQRFKALYPTYQEGLPLGYVNPSEKMGTNEPAKHKIIDIIGDLALCGRFLKGKVIAFRPGHGINNKLARHLRKEIRQCEVQAPIYCPDQEPIMNTERIRELLPHRFPFLLVDKVIEIGARKIVGVKSVSGNEPFFQGHFPEEPVMPGVLIVEAMAQTGGLLVLNSVAAEGESWSTYFLMIDKVKFRQKVVPGDTLLFTLYLTTDIRRGIANMRGLAFVGSKLVCEAEFTAQILKNAE